MEEYRKPVKSKMVILRASPGEIATMKENAQKRNMTLSRYIRFRCLFDKG